MSILKKKNKHNSLRLSLTVQQIKVAFKKYNIKITEKDILKLFLITDKFNDINLHISYFFIKVYGNIYRITDKNKKLYNRFFKTIVIKNLSTKEIIDCYIEYLKHIYGENISKQQVCNIFSDFNKNEYLSMIDKVYSYRNYLIKLQSIFQSEEINIFIQIVFIEKIINFAKNCGIKKLYILKWTEIIIDYCEINKISIYKFCKFANFFNFKKYLKESQALEIYKALAKE